MWSNYEMNENSKYSEKSESSELSKRVETNENSETIEPCESNKPFENSGNSKLVSGEIMNRYKTANYLLLQKYFTHLVK